MRSRRLALVALTLVLAAARSGIASTSAELLRCQKMLHTRATTYVKLVQTSLTNCAYRQESCLLAQEIDGDDPTLCIDGALKACVASLGKITVTKAATIEKVLLACLLIPPDELAQSVAGLSFATAACPTGSPGDLVPCVFDAVQCAAERTVFALDPRAAVALDNVGVGDFFPCVGP